MANEMLPEWVTPDYLDTVRGMFSLDPNLAIGAALIACGHPHAAQRVIQAPIIVLAIIKNRYMTLMDQQKEVLAETQKLFENDPSVEDLMSHFNLPFVLAKLSSNVLQRDHSQLFPIFRKIDQERGGDEWLPPKPLHEMWLQELMNEHFPSEYVKLRKKIEKAARENPRDLAEQVMGLLQRVKHGFSIQSSAYDEFKDRFEK